MSPAASRFTRFASAVAGVFALAVSAIPTAAAGEPVTAVRLFGTAERADPNLFMFHKWVAVLARYRKERALEDLPCTGGNCAVQHWSRFVDNLGARDRLAQLEAVSTYVNGTRYQADDRRYGVADYWATPREFFGRSGDCEDYALAKYLSLRKLGWPADRLRIVVMMHHGRRELHAILVAYHGGTALVLDNLLARPTDHRALPHYQPIYSINEERWFRHKGWSASRRTYAALPPRDDLAAPVVADARFAVPPRTISRTAVRVAARRPARAHGAESIAALFTGTGAAR